MGFSKNSSTLFSHKKYRSVSSQTKDTKIPVEIHNDILQLLVEINDAICVSFLKWLVENYFKKTASWLYIHKIPQRRT